MRTLAAVARAAAVALVTAVLLAPPVDAHGIGGREDLPLPAWLFSYGAGAVVVISFLALALLWPRPRMEGGAEGRPLPNLVQRAARPVALSLRALGLAAFAVVFAAAACGNPSPSRNIAPTAVYIVLWVGLQVVSALIGDAWAVLSPFDTLAAVGQRVFGRRRAGTTTTLSPERFGQWPAAVLLFGFAWLELAHPDPSSPRVVAGAIAAYTTIVLAGAGLWGRGWLRQGEAFAAYFGLLAHAAPLFRDRHGVLRVRPPLAGLARLGVLPGTAAVVFVALGSTTFDGLSRTGIWTRLTAGRFGWQLTPVATVGLVWAVTLVAAAFYGAMWAGARVAGRRPAEMARSFIHSLVPIALAYAVAHYFSLLLLDGQSALALVSDPLGRGWDVFGTAGRRVDYLLVSAAAIAFVQAGSIVVGHVAGVITAHDRAVGLVPASTAARAQYPLLAVMVVYTVGGLALLLGG